MDKEDKRIMRAIKTRAHRRVIAVDFDGTICEESVWSGSDNFGKPIGSVINELLKEKSSGSYIIIHTCRATTIDCKPYHRAKRLLRRWLATNGVPFDEIWSKPGKPFAHEYWDNCAVKKP